MNFSRFAGQVAYSRGDAIAVIRYRIAQFQNGPGDCKTAIGAGFVRYRRQDFLAVVIDWHFGRTSLLWQANIDMARRAVKRYVWRIETTGTAMLKWIVIALGIPAAIVWFATTNTAQQWAAETRQCDSERESLTARNDQFKNDLRAATATRADVARLQTRRQQIDSDIAAWERRCK